MKARQILGAMAAMLLAGAPAAHAAPSCISRQQVADMTIALLPPLVDKTRETCGNRLPDTAFINTPPSSEMANRFRAVAATRTASAAEGIRKLGEMEMPEGVTDETLVKLMGEMLPSMAVKSPDGDVCGNLNDLLGSLAPLSPEQAGRLIASFFAMAEVKSPTICKT
jgi:hypothetical protein